MTLIERLTDLQTRRPWAPLLFVAAVTLAVRRGMPESDRLVDCLDRTLLAQRHVDRNAHQAALVECWLGDLARCLTGQKLTLAE